MTAVLRCLTISPSRHDKGGINDRAVANCKGYGQANVQVHGGDPEGSAAAGLESDLPSPAPRFPDFLRGQDVQAWLQGRAQEQGVAQTLPPQDLYPRRRPGRPKKQAAKK